MAFLFEAGVRKVESLKNIDNLFKELKRAIDSSEREMILRELESTLKELFGIPVMINIHYFGRYGDNFAVLPQITTNKTTNVESTSDLIKIINVKKLYLIIGYNLIKLHTPQELTALLLHEIGHLTYHISEATKTITRILQPLFSIAKGLRLIPFIGVAFLPVYVICSRSLFAISHMGEYHADKFVAEYGYGDDLISAIDKWHKLDLKDTPTNFLDKIAAIERIFTGSTHPEDVSRIEKITESIKKEYLHIYPGKETQKVLQQYG